MSLPQFTNMPKHTKTKLSLAALIKEHGFNYVNSNITAENFPHDRPILHLTWCVNGQWQKEYDALPWYRKLFANNPADARLLSYRNPMIY